MTKEERVKEIVEKIMWLIDEYPDSRLIINGFRFNADFELDQAIIGVNDRDDIVVNVDM